MEWRKSSRCAGNGACVEVTNLAGIAFVRDSRKSDSPIIVLPRGKWLSFLNTVKKM